MTTVSMRDALLRSALALHQAGRLADAAQEYREVLNGEPKNFDALYMLGLLHFQRGEFMEAEHLIGNALTVNPRSLDGWCNRGAALMKLERHQEALASFESALSLDPAVSEAQLGRAAALMELQRISEALDILDHAVSLKPNSAEAWNNRGNVLLAAKRPHEALSSFEKAVALRPESAQIWNNRGNALAALDRFREAVASYDKALVLRPGNAGNLNHRAIAQFCLKNYTDAARDFAQVQAIDSNLAYAPGNSLYSKLHACDWSGLTAAKAAIAAALVQGRRVLTSIQSATFFDSAETQLRASSIWVADKYRPAPEQLWRGEIYRHDRIRLAYLSADFHAHATAALMAGVFEYHDRSRFDITAVSFGPDDKSAMRARLERAFPRLVDVRAKTDADAARMLKHMEIDIAVDLKGHTQDARPGILSHRPAPIQAHYLGFPGTMGADYIDYVIADGIVIPDADRPFYSEKIACLPDTYQCNDSKRHIAELTPARSELGLPENGFVFAAFNNSYKITPDMFYIWMRLLSAVDESVLWLLEDNAAAVDNLRREAGVRGVDSYRLIFAPRIDLADHLARHRRADLFLDTLPYGAHTTASDALWAGLPVLTCMGTTFAGRVAASLLHAVGLPELIAHSLPEYEALALKYARDPVALAAIKAKLARNRNACALFDTARFTRYLEAAYTTMWERRQRGLDPASFAVERTS